MIFITLSGKYVRVEEATSDLWKLYYRHVELGYFEERSKKVYEIEDIDLE